MPCSLLDSSSLSLLPLTFIDGLNGNGGGRAPSRLSSSSTPLSRLAAPRFGLTPIARSNILQEQSRGTEADENDQKHAFLPITTEEGSTRRHDGARQKLLQTLQSVLDMIDDDIMAFQQLPKCPNRSGVVVGTPAPESDRHIDFRGDSSTGSSADTNSDNDTNAASK